MDVAHSLRHRRFLGEQNLSEGVEPSDVTLSESGTFNTESVAGGLGKRKRNLEGCDKNPGHNDALRSD